MKILFSGGGTLGPVTPLLAVIEELHIREQEGKIPPCEILWIGTERGVELPLLRKVGIEVVTIPCAKLRRYFDFKNITDIGRLVRGFFSARKILKEFSPVVVVTAGGFVSVPVHYAAWTLGIPTLVHQQDIRVGLANRVMSWIARRITVSVEAHLKKFSKIKTIFIGNPVRPSVLVGSRERALELFHLNPELATVFAFGGGTGAEHINLVMEQIAVESAGQFQIIHLTGSNRAGGRVAATRTQFEDSTYHPYPFFTAEMADAYAAADIIIARAGFNTITEIAAWKKPAILIPIHGSHQTENATWAVAQGAAVLQDEISMTPHGLLQEIRDILSNEERYSNLADHAATLFPFNARERLTDEILALGIVMPAVDKT